MSPLASWAFIGGTLLVLSGLMRSIINDELHDQTWIRMCVIGLYVALWAVAP